MSKKETMKKSGFSLPRYLRLEKGTMWFDIEGEHSSGIRLYTNNKVFVGRDPKHGSEIPKDKYGNENLSDYGWKEQELPWYVDTTTLPTEKLSRLITAYKMGILVETDPTTTPFTNIKVEIKGDFEIDKNGDRIFIGKNNEVYKRLQNMTFDKLRDFINSCPITQTGRNNLMDLYDYEQKGYNPLSRPRFEVLELVRKKLNEYGPGISPIRVNED